MRLWFVTPAFERYAMTALCLDQRLTVIAELAPAGIEAHCVVIADDANLDLARERGFDTVERDNEWLGRRFNDGIEYAAKQGADFIVPIGSDSWIDPAYFLPLPPQGTRTSRSYCAVTADRLAELNVRTPSGAGPYLLTRRQLARSSFRPAADELKRGIDRSTVAGLGLFPQWMPRTVHPFQYVGFRCEPYITSYESLTRRWLVKEHDPWSTLAKHYPADLVERARVVMQGLASVA